MQAQVQLYEPACGLDILICNNTSMMSSVTYFWFTVQDSDHQLFKTGPCPLLLMTTLAAEESLQNMSWML